MFPWQLTDGKRIGLERRRKDRPKNAHGDLDDSYNSFVIDRTHKVVGLNTTGKNGTKIAFSKVSPISQPKIFGATLKLKLTGGSFALLRAVR